MGADVSQLEPPTGWPFLTWDACVLGRFLHFIKDHDDGSFRISKWQLFEFVGPEHVQDISHIFSVFAENSVSTVSSLHLAAALLLCNRTVTVRFKIIECLSFFDWSDSGQLSFYDLVFLMQACARALSFCLPMELADLESFQGLCKRAIAKHTATVKALTDWASEDKEVMTVLVRLTPDDGVAANSVLSLPEVQPATAGRRDLLAARFSIMDASAEDGFVHLGFDGPLRVEEEEEEEKENDQDEGNKQVNKEEGNQQSEEEGFADERAEAGKQDDVVRNEAEDDAQLQRLASDAVNDIAERVGSKPMLMESAVGHATPQDNVEDVDAPSPKPGPVIPEPPIVPVCSTRQSRSLACQEKLKYLQCALASQAAEELQQQRGFTEGCLRRACDFLLPLEAGNTEFLSTVDLEEHACQLKEDLRLDIEANTSSRPLLRQALLERQADEVTSFRRALGEHHLEVQPLEDLLPNNHGKTSGNVDMLQNMEALDLALMNCWGTLRALDCLRPLCGTANLL